MKAIFTASADETSNGIKLRQYTGQEVEVGAELGDDKRDLAEVGRMWTVTAADGQTFDVFEDELEFLNGRKA